MRADLHVHTVESDGADTFEEALASARDAGIACLAFTNHDTTRGLSAAIALGAAYGVAVLGGIEVSAWDAKRRRKVHVLGYGVREGSPALAALCDPLLERRRRLSLWQLDRLAEAGYPIDVERALAYGAASTCLYKQHLMAAMTDEPSTSVGYRRLYRSVFKGDGICARDIDYLDARDAVRAIVEDGGVPVIAHPGQLDSFEIAVELADLGLAGIEQHHPDHSPEDRARCAQLAERCGFELTGGSDYHGAFGRRPGIGCCFADLPDGSAVLAGLRGGAARPCAPARSSRL